METKRITVDLDPALYRRLRVAAFQTELTMTDIAREALERWLDTYDRLTDYGERQAARPGAPE